MAVSGHRVVLAPPPRPVADLMQLAAGAQAPERKALVRLSTSHGVGNRRTLLPRRQPEHTGLVTIWHDGGACAQGWRPEFERRATRHTTNGRDVHRPHAVRQGHAIQDVDDAMLEVLTFTHREAKGNRIGASSDAP
jgi:hypothetical protein